MKTIDASVYIKWYQDMTLWRMFENECRSLYLKQKIRGFLHLYDGQEAVAAGITHAMDLSKDHMITAYRCHVLALSMGIDPYHALAELLGKSTGTSKGMGGSMHLFSKQHRFYGGHGIVGGQIPLGAGIAFADKYAKRDAVTLTLMGEGAVRQGVFHETLNMAMNWKLPVVFVCENNHYSMGTALERVANHVEVYKLALGYEMPSEVIDGLNPIKVAEATFNAIERARKGEGPSFLDIRTYRFRGHSMSDAQHYRTKEEIEIHKQKDPILWVKNQILANKWETEENLENMKQVIKETIKTISEKAQNDPFPDPDQVYRLVYEQPDYPFIDKY